MKLPRDVQVSIDIEMELLHTCGSKAVKEAACGHSATNRALLKSFI